MRPLIRRFPSVGLGLSVLLALACAACGASTTSTSSTPRTATSSTSSTVTSSTTTDPGSSTTTTTSSTTTAALPGAGKPTITVGDKNFTEQFVLGELYTEALKAQGFTVQLNRNIGPTDVTLQALKAGTLTVYPEYLNVFDTAIAHYSHSFPTSLAAYAAATRYADAHGMGLLSPTPFSDTDGIGLTVGYAAANHLHILSDLSKVARSLTIGGPPQFEQSTPGLPTIEKAYGLTPAAFKTLGVGDQYAALNDGTVQAADVGTTDGQLASGDYTLLGDPGNLFGWGNVVPVVAASALTTEGPVFADTIERIDAVLTVPVMRRLNQAVDVSGEDPAAVAQQFLETHGLIPPAPAP
jgi:osmoprotectant transport system substrate-binding protein